MNYLITQMLTCLIIAFILGLFIGFLCCKIFCCKKTNKTKTRQKKHSPIPTFIDENEDRHHENLDDIDADHDLDSENFTIDTLEGIGPKTADLFAKVNIRTIGDYLRKLYHPDARVAVANELGIKVDPVHDWASMSDLLRIDGINHQYAELLHATNIKKVSDLADASAMDLTEKLVKTNTAGTQLIAPETPNETQVANWIERAKSKKPIVIV